jgi:hypothetical protein
VDLKTPKSFKAENITDPIDVTVATKSNTLVQNCVNFVDEDLLLAKISADIRWFAIQAPHRHSLFAQAQTAIAPLKASYARTICYDI